MSSAGARNEHRSDPRGEHFRRRRLPPERPAALVGDRLVARRQQAPRKDAARARIGGVEPRPFTGEVEPAALQQPSRGVLDDRRDFEQHLGLDPRRNPVVERFDLGPKSRQIKDFADDPDRRAQCRARPAGARPHVADKGDAGAVDKIVGDDRGGDLAAQRMGRDLRAEPLAQGGREIAAKLVGKLRRIGQVGGEEFGVERHLGIAEQHREFRAN